jgi:hypothetical protein
MKSLLLLLAIFFGAEAESQGIQKLLAYARQLNQTLGSLAGLTMRRLQTTITIPPMPSGCPAACDGIQCAYDDLAAATNEAMNGGYPRLPGAHQGQHARLYASIGAPSLVLLLPQTATG